MENEKMLLAFLTLEMLQVRESWRISSPKNMFCYILSYELSNFEFEMLHYVVYLSPENIPIHLYIV